MSRASSGPSRSRSRAAALALVLTGCAHGPVLGGPDSWTVVQDETFTLTEPAEVVAELTVSCATCDWSQRGREAAVLSLTVDGRYSQDLPVVQGKGPAPYRVLLGPLDAGTHRLSVSVDGAVSAVGAHGVSARVVFAPVAATAPEHLALSLAPVLYQRPNAVGAFTDVPLLMWYESQPTEVGTRLRYSVVFSNEDGGTPVDRLMATWGRVTDIELVYEVEIDAHGAVIQDVYQGPDHNMQRFAGQREGRHPLLWVVTDNNMVSDRGQTRRRHWPAPERIDLRDVSREAVMDAHPWTYRVMAEEARREGRVQDDVPLGLDKIPDPRQFVYLEACGDVDDAVLAFDVGIVQSGRLQWLPSDGGGLARYRIARSGCFRGAVALPSGAPDALEAVRFRAHTRPPREGEVPLTPGMGTVRITRVNRLFRLGADYVPGPDLMHWAGEARLSGEGPPLELPISRR